MTKRLTAAMVFFKKKVGGILRFFIFVLFISIFAFAKINPDEFKESSLSELISLAGYGAVERYRAPTGVSEADDHAGYIIDLLKAKIQVENKTQNDFVIDIIQEGETIPKELGWIITRLHHAGFKIRVLRHTPKKDGRNFKDDLIRKLVSTEDPFYVLDRSGDENAQKLVKQYSPNVRFKLWSEIKKRLKWFFSLPNGFTLNMHLDKETGILKDWKEQALSVLYAGGFSAYTYWLSSQSIAKVAMEYPEVNASGALIATAITTFFWQYNQEATDRRHKQGKAYYHDRKKMFPNTFLFNLSMFFDSFLTNGVIQTILYNGDVTTEMVGHWAENSAVGILAKGPKVFLTQLQDKMNKALYKTLNLAFNVLQSFMKVAHLYKWSEVGTIMFYTFAAVGVICSGYQHFLAARRPEESRWTKIKRQFRKDLRRLKYMVSGRKMSCGETLIYLTPRESELDTTKFVF